ncbi:MAG: hypothetical protein KIS62_01250 [Ramlibacter sp.]|nr:hypothetical protein [Ramlibacter sp.]
MDFNQDGQPGPFQAVTQFGPYFAGKLLRRGKSWAQASELLRRESARAFGKLLGLALMLN